MNTLSAPILYADGIGKVISENGVIKINFVTMQDHYTGTGSKPQKVPVTTATIVLSPAGFQQAYTTLQNMFLSMEKDEEINHKKPNPKTPKAVE